MSASRDKCRDCGEPYVTERWRGRTDVCDVCMTMRDRLVKGEIVPFQSDEFKMIQKKMCGGGGTAKRYIDSLLAQKEQP